MAKEIIQMLNFSAVSAEICLAAIFVFVIVFDLVVKKPVIRRLLPTLTAFLISFTMALATAAAIEAPGDVSFYNGLFAVDGYALYFKNLCTFAVIMTLIYSSEYLGKAVSHPAEYISLIVAALGGMCLMASANDFLTGFIGLELMTVSFYVLASLAKDGGTAGEAAVKYLLVGASSTAIMLYGISLIYGTGGSLIFSELQFATPPSGAQIIGIALVVIGFFFKLSIIPFHMWAPDVYQGAPTPVTGLLAMGSKAAAFALFGRVLSSAFFPFHNYWSGLLAIFAAVSMIFGNIMAIKQTNVKRMLAYSSIAQAGYMTVGLVAADAAGMKAVMIYLALYVVANIGAFAVLTLVEAGRGGTSHSHLVGLCKAAPLPAAVLTISLLSMAGIPPTAGFAGKLYLFTAAVDQGYLWLAFIGFTMSMVSVYYYLLVAKAMYRDVESGEQRAESGAYLEQCEEQIEYPFLVRLILLVAVFLTLAIGICPELISHSAAVAAETLFM